MAALEIHDDCDRLVVPTSIRAWKRRVGSERGFVSEEPRRSNRRLRPGRRELFAGGRGVPRSIIENRFNRVVDSRRR